MLQDGSIKIFSRNAEDNTAKYPDLIEMLPGVRDAAVTSCILDGEVVAYDREKDAILPFQVLSTRARKGTAIEDIKVQVLYVAFDILYYNGEVRARTPSVGVGPCRHGVACFPAVCLRLCLRLRLCVCWRGAVLPANATQEAP